MRILHTADWHLCNRLDRIDRTSDLQIRVERVAALCDEHQVDVLLVAGDLFDDRAELPQMTAALEHILATFDPFFRRGGTILAVTGNHDKDVKIDMVRSGMKLASPFARAANGRIAAGRMYLNNGRGIAALEGRDGRAVQFVFVPYPFASRYDFGGSHFLAREELNKALHAKVAEWLAEVPSKPEFDLSLPTVLLGHLHVRGAELHCVYKMNESDDVQFDFADLQPNWAYVALGHVHKPQMIGGQAHVRYPGSLDRLDITEAHEHGAILFDVGPSGLLGEPAYLRIEPTPFHKVTIADLDQELPGLAAKYPDRETAIVEVEIRPHSHVMSRDEATRELRRAFPRLHKLNWLESERPESAQPGPRVDTRDSLETTVRKYLDSLSEFQADDDRDEILALLETFLKDGAA